MLFRSVVLGSRPKQRPSLLGLSARSALTRDARAGCASRARGQRPLPVCPSPASLVRQSGRALCSGVKATEVWIPDQTSGAQAPYFGGLLGPAVRSAAKAATPPQFALRARGRRPLPVGPSLPGWVPLFFKIKVLLDFFQKIAVSKGRAFGRSSQ